MKNCTHTHFQTLLWWPAVRASLNPNVNIPPPRYCRQMNITMQLPPLLSTAGYTQRQSCESEWCSLSHRVFLNVHISVTDIRNVSLFHSPFRSYTAVSLLLSFFLSFSTRTVENQSIDRKTCNRNKQAAFDSYNRIFPFLFFFWVGGGGGVGGGGYVL